MTIERNSTMLHRLTWSILTTGGLAALSIAAWLEPDARGYGTHTQLGLPPCGLRSLTGMPCPGCGLTTAFAHAVRGDWSLALSANPLGLVLFLTVCLCVPIGVAAAIRGWSVDVLIERWGAHRWALAVAGCAVAVWASRVVAWL